jgi:hypothetical protein
MTAAINYGGKAMKPGQQRVLKLSFTIVALVSLLSAVNAASNAASNDSHRPTQSQQMYDYNYNNPATLTVSPGCYLPSDGCLSEYSVQN